MHILTLGAEREEVVWNGFLRAGYSTWPLGMECDVHYHQAAVEIFIFLEGSCEITVGDEVATVNAGQAVYVGPNVAHKLKAVGDGPMKMFLFVAPNHEPTHTIVDPGGATRDTNRPPPPEGQVWMGKGD